MSEKEIGVLQKGVDVIRDGAFLIEVDRCSTCDARIFWAQTAKGRAMPVDADSRADGNVVLQFPDDARDPPVAHVDPRRRLEGPRYVAHFSTCPNADQHRKA